MSAWVVSCDPNFFGDSEDCETTRPMSIKAKGNHDMEKPPIDMDLVRKSNELRNRGYHGIGRFLHEFSQLEFTIRAVLASRLGLEDRYFDIVTASYDFRILCAVTSKVTSIMYPEKKPEVEALFKECQSLNDSRVHVAHGTWIDDTDGLSARVFSRNALETTHRSFKNDELLKLADKAQELLQRVIGFRAKA